MVKVYRMVNESKEESTKQWYFVNTEDPRKKIHLSNNERCVIGRNERCQIDDPGVSRSHMICIADIDKRRVAVKVTGRNISTCNGLALHKGKWYNFGHGDRIELVVGGQVFELLFGDGTSENTKTATASSSSSRDEITEKFNSEPNSKKVKLDYMDKENTWEQIDKGELLVFTPNGCLSRSKIAGFDIDGTIIKTKSGARFPKDKDDWAFNLDSVPKKLQELNDKNYKIVFFTNQLSLARDSSKVRLFKTKVGNIISKLALPIQVFVATSKSQYRKPITGAWDVLCKNKNDNIAVDLKESFYVGDAAGREKNWAPKKNKDHSICDRLFALNIGIKFFTPEEYFLGAPKIRYVMPEFDPKNMKIPNIPDFNLNKTQEVIIMVGAQGSGKTHFCKNKIVSKGYVYISRDELGSWQKCVQRLEDCLQDKKSAVVDNTNPDKDSRAKYICIAKKLGVECRCFWMNLSLKHCKHNNRFRELVDKSHAVISEILINSYNKNFREPEISEGFSEIVKVPFVPEFKNSEHEKLYRSYLLES